MLVNICINLHILFGLLLDAQSKFSKHANSFVAYCINVGREDEGRTNGSGIEAEMYEHRESNRHNGN